MTKICILSALLLQLLYTSIQGQNSPCPDRFTYIKKPGSNNTIGQIEIRIPLHNQTNYFEFHLKVDLKVATQVSMSFVGWMDLTKSKEDAARDVLEGRPLLYHINFPVQNPLPTVHRIWFNNDQICSGPEVSGNITTITLEHTLKIIIQPVQIINPKYRLPQYRPAEQKRTVSLSLTDFTTIYYFNMSTPISQHSNSSFLGPAAPPRNTNNYPLNNIFLRPNVSRLPSGPKINPKVKYPQYYGENYNECGLRPTLRERSPLIVGGYGEDTLPGQWPWVAAIFRYIHEYEFICGGTLLTTKHVLTAGHCLKTSPYTNETIPANILSVALGRYKLMDFNESESVIKDVARYIFHPEYTHTVSADSDLAILILMSPVEFTAFIRPICLLPPSVDSRRLEQTNGIVVGWGEDEYGNLYTEKPRLMRMPIVRTEDCFRYNPIYVTLTSESSFCAGSLHSGPCQGDSGSGLVVLDPVTNRYQLRGIVSRTLQSFCYQPQYVVFVDVFKYLTWINQHSIDDN